MAYNGGMAQVIVSAIGRDRPGLVGEFTKFALDRGLSLADARMLNMQGQFAMIVAVVGESPAIARLREELSGFASTLGLTVAWAPEAADWKPTKGLPFRLRVYSLDQPGIVHRVSSLLHRHGVNIEELESSLESAPFMGSPVFTMEIVMLVPKAVSVKDLRRELEELGDKLNCDVDIDPA